MQLCLLKPQLQLLQQGLLCLLPQLNVISYLALVVQTTVRFIQLILLRLKDLMASRVV